MYLTSDCMAEALVYSTVSGSCCILPVSLVQDQDLYAGELEGGCVVEVIDQTPRGGDQYVWTTAQRRLLGLYIQST